MEEMRFSNQDIFLREPGTLEILFSDANIQRNLYYGQPIHRKYLNSYSLSMKSDKVVFKARDSSSNIDILKAFMEHDGDYLDCEISFSAYGKQEHYGNIKECVLEMKNKKAQLVGIEIEEVSTDKIDNIMCCTLVFEMDGFNTIEAEERNEEIVYKLE